MYFLSLQEIFHLSIYQTELCIPARFIVSSSNCVSIEIQSMNLIWTKAPPGRGQTGMPSVRPWQKDELAGLLLADWVWLKCSQQLQSIYSTARLKLYQQPTITISTTPFLQWKTCLRPSNIQLWGFLPESRCSLEGYSAAHKKSRDMPYQGRNVSGQQPLQTHPTQTTAADTRSCRNS